jgi:hypothetical protein
MTSPVERHQGSVRKRSAGRGARAVQVLLILTALAVSGRAGEATTMRQHPLAEMVQEAERIFVGECVAATDGSLAQAGGSGIPYTEYVFQVREVLKGRLTERVTIRQFGVREPHPTPDGKLALVARVPGMPVYQPGQELLLFLIGDSALGLTSPVGLAQSAFWITREAGARRAVNGFNNAGLFRGMSPLAVSTAAAPLTADEIDLFAVGKGPLALDPFLSLIRKLVGEATP